MDIKKGSNKVNISPKDFFLYIAAMVALYVSAISLLALLFEYIDVLFPDRLEYYIDPYSGAIRFAIASLVIIYPAYIFLTRILNQDLRANPEKRELGIRKWLIFLTLFVAGVTIIVDLVALVNTFLGGDLTTRFTLKVISVLVVIGGVFWYYIQDLKGKWEKNEALSKKIGWIVSSAVLISVISGFFIIGSPQTLREIRFDQNKENDLQSIQWQIVNYWQQKGSIPITLEDLKDPISNYIIPVDKQTGEPYTYRKLSGFSFELCAEFNLKSRGGFSRNGERIVRPVKTIEPFGLEGGNWQHEEGETCFKRVIDPDLYPLRD